MNIEDSNFEIEMKTNPLNLIIKRKKTEEIIFELIRSFIFADQYIEFSFAIPSHEFHGWGERIFSFHFFPGTYSEFMVDTIGQVEIGKAGYNAHGHHPMYIIKEQSNLWHVHYIRNINGQEFVFDSDNTIRYRMIGGVIDLNFFLGDSPDAAIVKYHKYIGSWAIPAFWAIGKHQSKWNGYKSTHKIAQVLERYKDAGLPLDAIWSDIEYQLPEINFSFDERRYPPSEFKRIIDEYKKKWIIVIDPWIPYERKGPGWEYPDVLNLTIKNPDGSPYESRLLGRNYYLDYWEPRTEEFWNKMIDQIRDKVYFEGIWLDVNEGTKFRNFSVYSGPMYEMPFWPGLDNWYRLPMLPPELVYYGDRIEFNVRDCNCILQSNITYDHLKKTNKFPFVLARATAPGVGRYAAHFIPDYKSDWESMRYSVASMFNFGLYGFPFSGGDLCGNGADDKTPAELCARWYQLGTFYPFMRNHHVKQIRSDNYQEPYRYGGIYFDAIKAALLLRYAMLRYYYTIIFSLDGIEYKNGLIFKPLNFVFYNEPSMPPYGDAVYESQFMIGDGIMVAPSLYENEFSRMVFFPPGRWYDLRDLKEVIPRRGYRSMNLALPVLAPYFLRGGFIYYTQETNKVFNSYDLGLDYNFIIGLSYSVDNVATAQGKIMNAMNYDEDPIWQSCVERNCMVELSSSLNYENGLFTFSSKKISDEIRKKNEGEFFIRNITILGLDQGFLSSYDDKKSWINTDSKGQPIKISYDSKIRVMSMWKDTPFAFSSDDIFMIELN